MLVFMAAAPALACGGFFCSGGGYTGQYTVPVVQSAERILFRVNPDETITTFVEVAYQQNEDVDFGWVIPIPEPIAAEDVETASADLFNALEGATAPVFQFQFAQPSADTNGFNSASGCDGCVALADEAALLGATGGLFDEPVSVAVVATAVAGPFAIEVITATNAADFADWLNKNGYDLPEGAKAPLQHYVSQNFAYLGVKLLDPDAPTGPLDTLVFTYPGTEPMIPIILTGIAATEDLGIITYVLSDVPHEPGNWEILPDLAPDTLPDGNGGSDYLPRFSASVDAFDGKAFELEYLQPTDSVPLLGDPGFDALMAERAHLVRWRGEISPAEMTIDPSFVANPELGPYDNVHNIVLDFVPGATPPSKASVGWLPASLLWLVGLGVAVSRRRRA